ncbi:hypothetical protein Bca4012_076881 [Brassica carinata]|uniref:Uncharacterized protein n=1 Tax=Brassica carinata TaxID=52824 RepID=A0A8X7Q8W4_BRACI|nr:hypothetical protein Bca52824_072854 [Brassica carinata]
MTEQSNSPTTQSRRRRFSEADSSFGERYHFRSQVPFKSFEDRLQRSRLLFRNTVTAIGGYYRRHHNEEATIRWNKGSLVMSNSSGQRGGGPGSPGGVVLEKHKTLKSVGNLSIGSAVSTASGRKPFNRYV